MLPKTKSYLSIAQTCRSTYDKSIKTAHDDSFVLFFVEEGEEDSLCDGYTDVAAPKTPVLTSADWVEPISGRRYMCYDFMDGDSP